MHALARPLAAVFSLSTMAALVGCASPGGEEMVTVTQTITSAESVAPAAGPQPTLAGEPAAGPAPDAAPSPAEGNTVTGTVRVLTAPELVQLQGMDRTPNGEDEAHRFAVLVLDAPSMFSAKSSGNAGAMHTRETKIVGIGEQSPYVSDPTGFDLEDQRLALSFDPEDCWFPSDTSLPLGAPSCSSFIRN